MNNPELQLNYALHYQLRATIAGAALGAVVVRQRSGSRHNQWLLGALAVCRWLAGSPPRYRRGRFLLYREGRPVLGCLIEKPNKRLTADSGCL